MIRIYRMHVTAAAAAAAEGEASKHLASDLRGWKFISGFLPFLFARDELAMTISPSPSFTFL